MKTVVIGDLHGDWWGLRAILRATGAVDADGEREPEVFVIQLGDVIHGGSQPAPRQGVDDERCALMALDTCDVILLGNHELPHLWPASGFPRFAGIGAIAERVRLALLEGYAAGQVRAASSWQDWLLTHAGLHHRRRRSARLPGFAGEVAAGIGERFARRIETGWKDGLFDAVGRERGGSDDAGGIFWCDWGELTRCYAAAPGVSQIVGHTPQGSAPTFRQGNGSRDSTVGNLWCVDVGAALSGHVAALVRDESEGEWRPMVVRSDWGRE